MLLLLLGAAALGLAALSLWGGIAPSSSSSHFCFSFSKKTSEKKTNLLTSVSSAFSSRAFLRVLLASLLSLALLLGNAAPVEQPPPPPSPAHTDTTPPSRSVLVCALPPGRFSRKNAVRCRVRLRGVKRFQPAPAACVIPALPRPWALGLLLVVLAAALDHDPSFDQVLRYGGVGGPRGYHPPMFQV